MFTGLTADICRTAWHIVEAAARQAALDEVTDKSAGSIVVLSPVDGSLLFTASIDENNAKAAKYAEFAHAKADVCWKTGKPSHVVQQSAPHLYQPGMVKWGGGVVKDGLVVAFSGVQAVFDKTIAWNMLNWIIAICQDEMTKPGGVMESEDDFIPQPHLGIS
ncbi:MAG TPA: hypothetical protein VFQ70_02465 [Candidatus Saccharimonadaceae bacterium]|nr:hypothetical protein [Candidatus Saccharimonadaceae bacterium]